MPPQSAQAMRWGRRDEVHLRRGAWAVTGVAMVVVAATVYAFLMHPHALIGLFLDSNEGDRALILQAGGHAFGGWRRCFSWSIPCRRWRWAYCAGCMMPERPMVIAGVSYWMIGIPAAYYMGFVLQWQGVGVWLGLVVGLAVAAGLLMARFWIWSCKIEA